MGFDAWSAFMLSPWRPCVSRSRTDSASGQQAGARLPAGRRAPAGRPASPAATPRASSRRRRDRTRPSAPAGWRRPAPRRALPWRCSQCSARRAAHDALARVGAVFQADADVLARRGHSSVQRRLDRPGQRNAGRGAAWCTEVSSPHQRSPRAQHARGLRRSSRRCARPRRRGRGRCGCRSRPVGAPARA